MYNSIILYKSLKYVIFVAREPEISDTAQSAEKQNSEAVPTSQIVS